MGHAHWREWIDGLVSGELPGDRREEVERHLSSCEACRAEREALQTLRAATRGLADTHDPPPAVLTSVRSALDAADEELRPAPRRTRRRPPWLAAAAVLGLLLGGVWWLRATSGEDLPTAAVATYGLHREGKLPHAVETPDEAVLQRFLERQLDFPARVIDLRMMDFALLGGRVHELQGRLSALYGYRGADGRLVLCQMLRGTLEELPPADETHEERGFTFQVYRRGERTAIFWVEGEVLCVLVSDMPAPELLALAREKAMA